MLGTAFPPSLRVAIISLLLALYSTSHTLADEGVEFSVAVPEIESKALINGRMFVMLSTNADAEPRFQIADGVDTQQIFGIDVEDAKPGTPVVFDASVFGYPMKSLSDVPAGTYYAQALFHEYEIFNRADGHTVRLPMDRGEGQKWNRAPGNRYSTPVEVQLGEAGADSIELKLDRVIPAIEQPEDTEYIKHIKIKSKLLSEFWGRDMYLGAHVLLPAGFDEHLHARYPVVINHGHFPQDFGGFRPEPPDPNLEPDFSKRFNLQGYNRIVQEEAHDFYKKWTGPDFPRVILIKIQHANPFYDDSYAVNSENLGPYGDAITHELVPYIEEQFRGIGKGWARFLYGGSTGGWEALAAQVLYPEEYNGCFAACPDPIDFRAYTVVNLYEDKNAYYIEGKWNRIIRPGKRNYLGHVSATLEGMNHLELVLGTRSRSGQQWDIWEAVYSPVGEDGYPKRIWDKLTGAIDPVVANFWRENYDLSYIMRRDWKTLGPKLAGKVNIYCGDMDNYYLNNAVYLTEEFLESTETPEYAGTIAYGDRAEHCWNGDPDQPNAISRLRYHRMFIPLIEKRILESAPAGSDLQSWRY
ncbi:MAG: alpha/beta hydrolase-fold protein [Pirellulaceae bacterium]